MKKILLLAFSLCSLLSYAQNEAETLAVEGRCWTLRFASMEGTVFYEDYTLMADSAIEGVHYMREYKRTYNAGETPSSEWLATDILLGQEGSKVYLIDAKNNSPKTLVLNMDFTLPISEKVDISPVDYPDEMVTCEVVAQSDTIMPYSSTLQVRKYMTILANGLIQDVWVEGIGSLNNGISPYILGFHQADMSWQLVRCTQGNEILFMRDVYEHDYPTSLEEMAPVSIPTQDLYDLQGRPMENAAPKRLYIKGGKKIMMR